MLIALNTTATAIATANIIETIIINVIAIARALKIDLSGMVGNLKNNFESKLIEYIIILTAMQKYLLTMMICDHNLPNRIFVFDLFLTDSIVYFRMLVV